MEDLGRRRSKADKKIARCTKLLQKDLPDVQVSTAATQHIFIGNAGLTTGADDGQLVEVLGGLGVGGLTALTLLPGRQYSFATFSSATQARQVLEAAHGTLALPGTRAPLYMAYVASVPQVAAVGRQQHPPGLQVVQHFITAEEEQQLLSLHDWTAQPSNTALGSVLKHRQVRHYGYEFKYSTNSVDKDEPLAKEFPPLLAELAQRLVTQGLMPRLPDQVTVNRYLPGQGIPPHVDSHRSFTDVLVSLSTAGAVNMDFRHQAEHCVVHLPPRSLCVMAGPSRYVWSHGICPRRTDVVAGVDGLHLLPRQERVSFTFREVRRGECDCGHMQHCDSLSPQSAAGSEVWREDGRRPEEEAQQQQECEGQQGVVGEHRAAQLEREHVQQVYNSIAPHFSQTRHKPWPRVLQFVEEVSRGGLLLDVGCGNGKYLSQRPAALQIGCDSSSELMKICKTRGFEVISCNCLLLPFRGDCCDAIISIAVIHHLATEERRVEAVREMVRVLRRGGRGLVYVWAMEQRRASRASTYLKQNKTSKAAENGGQQAVTPPTPPAADEEEGMQEGLSCTLPVHVNRTEFKQQDIFVPWKLRPVKSKAGQKQDQDAVTTEEGGSISGQAEGPSVTEASITPQKVFHRYYHVFRQGELESLFQDLPVNIIESYYDEGNWCLIFKKM